MAALLHLCCMIRNALLTLILLCSTLCPAQKKDKELKKLFSMMQGSFSSQAQAAVDSAYFDIRLHMARIWPERTDGYWLYVEQAVAVMQQKPYRQRVYHVHRTPEGNLISEVFTLPAPLRFAGAFADAAKLKSITSDSLQLRTGCHIALAANGSNFAGSTQGHGCTSDLKGASYATSEVVISTDKLVSWDRGYNAENKQVWGAEKGGYVFIKQQ